MVTWIVGVAIKLPAHCGDEMLVAQAPNRHSDLFHALTCAEVPDAVKHAGIQGFVDSTGAFLNREEAFRVAARSSQIDPEACHTRELFSEDLW